MALSTPTRTGRKVNLPMMKVKTVLLLEATIHVGEIQNVIGNFPSYANTKLKRVTISPMRQTPKMIQLPVQLHF